MERYCRVAGAGFFILTVVFLLCICVVIMLAGLHVAEVIILPSQLVLWRDQVGALCMAFLGAAAGCFILGAAAILVLDALEKNRTAPSSPVNSRVYPH